MKFLLGDSDGHLDGEVLVGKLIQGFSSSLPCADKGLSSWDLPLVLRFLHGPPFEPIAEIDIKHLTLKSAFLIALTSARRLGEIGALLCHPPFLRVLPDSVVPGCGPMFLPSVVSRFSHLSGSGSP